MHDIQIGEDVDTSTIGGQVQAGPLPATAPFGAPATGTATSATAGLSATVHTTGGCCAATNCPRINLRTLPSCVRIRHQSAAATGGSVAPRATGHNPRRNGPVHSRETDRIVAGKRSGGSVAGGPDPEASLWRTISTMKNGEIWPKMSCTFQFNFDSFFQNFCYFFAMY